MTTLMIAYQVQIRRQEKGKGRLIKQEDPLKHFNKQLFSVSLKTVMDQAQKDQYLIEPQKSDVDMEVEANEDEEELKKAIEMSLEENKETEAKKDVVMHKEGQEADIKEVDMTLDLITYFKEQIISNTQKDTIMNADLSVYLM